MRNQEAARYARWAAMAAGMVALVVVGFYVVRAIRAARRHVKPAQVSASVQQQMQTFSYSGMQGNRTIFTIRASRATEFKAGSPALLEDVWISIYGSKGERNDSIHTRECSYEQKTGGVQCAGEVTIDIRPAKPQAGTPGQESMHLTTSNLSFDGQTGEAQTPAAVDFALPQGQGSGVGVTYRTRAAIVRVDHAVKFEMAATPRNGGLPVDIRAASLEVRRDDRKVLLSGPVIVQQGERELSAGTVTVSLGEKFHARDVVAQGNPSIRIARGTDVLRASANTLEANLTEEGWIEHVAARGNVLATRESPKGSSRFSSERVDFAMAATRNILREMTATGKVNAESQEGGISQTLNAPALKVVFASAKEPDKQRIEQAATLGSSTIGLKDARETTELRAPKFTAQFTAAGRLQHLLGATGVDVRRMPATGTGQTSTAQTLNATFARDGQWNRVEEDGSVTFQQGDRRATAQHAKIDQASGGITLSGTPVIEDAESRTTADTVAIGQKSGEFLAEGNVVTTYFPAKRATSAKAETAPAHITAQKLSGSTTSGQVTYSGRARLWQGQSVLQADDIAISRDQKKLQATGNVLAVFAQTAGANLLPSAPKKPGPTLWQARAPELTYSGDAGQVHMAGGVRIVSGDVSLVSRTLDLELGAPKGAGPEDSSLLAKGELNQAVAHGNVVVRQGALRASAEQAIYTAADGKFVLSGGKPTITDGSGNSASGRSLTFFLPNDTILIDSQEGSRTLTKYRVEK